MSRLIVALVAFFAAARAFAESPDLGVPSLSHWYQLYLSVGRGAGLWVMLGVVVFVQAVVFVERKHYPWLASGFHRLILVVLMTMIATFPLLSGLGVDHVAAFAHSASLVALQVLVHQLYSRVNDYLHERLGKTDPKPCPEAVVDPKKTEP